MQRFNLEGKGMTVITRANGDPWFVAKEICEVLGIKNTSHAVSKLDPDDKNTIVLNEGIRNSKQAKEVHNAAV